MFIYAPFRSNQRTENGNNLLTSMTISHASAVRGSNWGRTGILEYKTLNSGTTPRITLRIFNISSLRGRYGTKVSSPPQVKRRNIKLVRTPRLYLLT